MFDLSWFRDIPGRFPWILEKGRNCIISPDCDGMLCGLLMSHFLDWRVRGFYDGKILAVADGVRWEDCVFLDMEIFRKDVKSIGQHMLLVNRNQKPANWRAFDSCISPNNLRGFDSLHDFKWKYPLGTIHLLLAILSAGGVEIKLSRGAFKPLLFVDGVFKNLLNYPENCLDWLGEIDFENNCLKDLFCDKILTLREFMGIMREFFGELDAIGKNASKVIISDRKGHTANLHEGALSSPEKSKAESFLSLIGNNTGWEYNADAWQWRNLNVATCEKTSIANQSTRNFNHEVESKSPFSWAIISRQSIEMTVKPPCWINHSGKPEG